MFILHVDIITGLYPLPMACKGQPLYLPGHRLAKGNETTTLGTVGMIHLTWFDYTVHAFDKTTPAGSLVRTACLSMTIVLPGLIILLVL